jgi:hypothetical protein
MNWLLYVSPIYWFLMRSAAVARHAALVYSVYGDTPYAEEQMLQHLRLVETVYD